MTELQKAAERLQLVDKGHSIETVYKDMVAYPTSSEFHYNNDVRKVYQAYLAEHSADDDDVMSDVKLPEGDAMKKKVIRGWMGTEQGRWKVWGYAIVYKHKFDGSEPVEIRPVAPKPKKKRKVKRVK